MLALKGRQDAFKLLLPKEFIPEHINEKYSKILREQRGFINKPIDFLNETIQKIEVLGFNNATVAQSFQGKGDRINSFAYSGNESYYRSPSNPQALIDKTLNIQFKHTLGFLNYFMIFESFLYHYSRDQKYKNMPKQLSVDLLNEKGSIYARIVLENPLIDAIDMLSFDYTKPIAESQTFQVVIKYSSFDYQFVQAEESNWNGEVE